MTSFLGTDRQLKNVLIFHNISNERKNVLISHNILNEREIFYQPVLVHQLSWLRLQGMSWNIWKYLFELREQSKTFARYMKIFILATRTVENICPIYGNIYSNYENSWKHLPNIWKYLFELQEQSKTFARYLEIFIQTTRTVENICPIYGNIYSNYKNNRKYLPNIWKYLFELQEQPKTFAQYMEIFLAKKHVGVGWRKQEVDSQVKMKMESAFFRAETMIKSA